MPTEETVLVTSAPNVDLAMDALEAAAFIAEGKPAELIKATTEDFAAAVAKDAAKVRVALDRVIMGEDPENGLDRLLDCSALQVIFPEVHMMVGFGDGEWRHKDVWKHTKQVVRQATPRIEVRWSALFHDIGKVKTRSFTTDGKVHFFGHAEVGARMFDKMDKRLRLFAPDESLKSTVRFLVLHHLRANQYDPNWTDSAVRRFARELGDHLEDLFCLSRADITTKRPEKKRKGIQQLDDLEARIAKLAAEDAQVPPLPPGVGDAIMKEFNIPPSRLIGDIKRALEQAIEKGEVPSHEESSVYVEYVRTHRDVWKL